MHVVWRERSTLICVILLIHVSFGGGKRQRIIRFKYRSLKPLHEGYTSLTVTLSLLLFSVRLYISRCHACSVTYGDSTYLICSLSINSSVEAEKKVAAMAKWSMLYHSKFQTVVANTKYYNRYNLPAYM